MPKKFGTNSKSAEAKAKKAEQKQTAKVQEDRKKEEAKWVDNDKKVMAKEMRRKEQEEKKTEALERKQQNKKLHDEEMSKLTASKTPEPVRKLTQAEIEAQRNALIATIRPKNESIRPKNESISNFVPDSDSLRLDQNMNPNHARRQEVMSLKEREIETIDVRDLNSAINALATEEPDRHPEKRLKQAHNEYVEKRLPELRLENPGMKRSQLMEKIWKEWQKAPENPLNQNSISYNAKV